ncbi:MAG: acetoin dehydrogenase dihydrolipoyllysine-residue acetyltransferase subunit [Ardenticatenaceae bacterium]|nr:acetoin dehydrogenase dihydrolipoyllysine-residue acetyltransferase subunit [Ardenticatenaceae bacterium]
MITAVYVPRWGITMQKGLIAAWLADVGERVTKGQPLLELETEKIANVVEAPGDGVLRAVLVQAGETPRVGELIAIIAEPDEAFDLATLQSAGAVAEGEASPARQRREARPAERTARGRVRSSPAARRLAQEHGLDVAGVAGTGPEGSISREDVEQAIVDAVAATVEDGEVEVGGLRLHYVAAGGAASGLKTSHLPVVLVHGLGGSTLLWQPNVTALATSHRVIALDLPGHGRSGKPPADYSVEFFAGALAGFLEAMGLERAALVGHSFGGHACLRLALAQPERVARLVLVDAGGLGPEISTGFLQPMLAGLSREATESMLAGLFHNPALVMRPMVEATHEMLAQPGAWEALVAAAGRATAGGSQTEVLLDRVNELTMPVLLIWGGADAVIPVAHGRAAQAAIRGAELWVAENAGHCPQLEAAEAFNTRVAAFLAP